MAEEPLPWELLNQAYEKETLVIEPEFVRNASRTSRVIGAEPLNGVINIAQKLRSGYQANRGDHVALSPDEMNPLRPIRCRVIIR